MKRLTTLIYKGRTFEVVDLQVVNEAGLTFGTIDEKYISNGKITKALNGMEMRVSNTMEMAIDNRKFQIDVEDFMAQGLSVEDACKQVMLNNMK